ncbi:MAG: hypothetical protein MZV65_02215 [Chromatiales bacterium]|nr:hypothetical protein [Chromatiales bacterium]
MARRQAHRPLPPRLRPRLRPGAARRQARASKMPPHACRAACCPWLFALTLLFGQAAAFAHALSHLGSARIGAARHRSAKSASRRRNWGRLHLPVRSPCAHSAAADGLIASVAAPLRVDLALRSPPAHAHRPTSVHA